MESNFVFGLQSVQGKVSQLASNETFKGNPNYIAEDIARYAGVTKADVMRVYKKYIKGKHGVIMSVVPNGKLDMAARKDTFTPKERTFDRTKATTKTASLIQLNQKTILTETSFQKLKQINPLWFRKCGKAS